MATPAKHRCDSSSLPEQSVVIPLALMAAKNFCCAYVSLAAAELFVPGSSKWHRFAFLYGMVPTSSAPMLVAMRVGEHVNVVSAAVCLGTLLAIPMLAASSVLLGSDSVDQVGVQVDVPWGNVTRRT